MNNPNWAKAYTRDIQRVDKGIGGHGFRAPLYPNGQEALKIGRATTINNTVDSAQKMSRQVTIARYLPQASGGVTGSQTLKNLVYSPTERFRCEVRVAFEPDTSQGDPAFNVTPQWSIYNVSKNPMTGRETRMQLAYPSAGGTKNLPDAYEFDSAALAARIDVVLSDADMLATYVPTTEGCNVVLIATWEPNSYMDADEKARLFALCSISYPQILNIQNNAV